MGRPPHSKDQACTIIIVNTLYFSPSTIIIVVILSCHQITSSLSSTTSMQSYKLRPSTPCPHQTQWLPSFSSAASTGGTCGSLARGSGYALKMESSIPTTSPSGRSCVAPCTLARLFPYVYRTHSLLCPPSF